MPRNNITVNITVNDAFAFLRNLMMQIPLKPVVAIPQEAQTRICTFSIHYRIHYYYYFFFSCTVLSLSLINKRPFSGENVIKSAFPFPLILKWQTVLINHDCNTLCGMIRYGIFTRQKLGFVFNLRQELIGCITSNLMCLSFFHIAV